MPGGWISAAVHVWAPEPTPLLCLDMAAGSRRDAWNPRRYSWICTHGYVGYICRIYIQQISVSVHTYPHGSSSQMRGTLALLSSARLPQRAGCCGTGPTGGGQGVGDFVCGLGGRGMPVRRISAAARGPSGGFQGGGTMEENNLHKA